MLILEDLLNKMKIHFPRWMDIRRKINKSTGGLIVTSMAEEMVDVQSAIEDYKKDFFLDNYIGKEDNVITYLYKAQIGFTDVDSIELVYPAFNITEDENVFYSTEKTAYYKDGTLYLKDDYEDITYLIDSYRSTIETEKIHVWNIFDEFAVFLGLRRYQWESNKELLNRIISFSNKKVNSSEEGIKNAILANLINIDPNLSAEDIKIERPTAENLVKYYNEFETILDHLSDINRDVYKAKKWDIDTWNFKMKSIDYIPHAWDVALTSYANGIGFNDDLKVSIVDDEAKTDATISFYNKKQEILNTYLKNHNITKDYKLQLKKYDNDLKADIVKYRIIASEALKLATDEIAINLYENRIGSFDVNLEDVVDNFLFGINIEDASCFHEDFDYKINLFPRDPYKEFRIDHCNQIDKDGASINLLKYNSPGFSKIGQGLYNTKTKKYVIDNYQFSSTYNNIKTTKGFEIDNLSEEANYVLNINGCSNQNIFYDYEYTEIPMLLSSIKTHNCYIENDYIIADTVSSTKYLEFTIEANTFSANIIGPYTIQYSINDGQLNVLSNSSNKDYQFKIDGYKTPQKIYVRIDLTGEDEENKVTNLSYSKFSLEIATKHGNFYGSRLPNIDKNELYINMRSYTGFSPVIKYIYIGEALTERDQYPEIDFKTLKGNKLDIQATNCRIQVSKVNKSSGTIIETIKDYKPYKHYSSESSMAQIELMLHHFDNIEEIITDVGTIETINYGDSYVQHVLKLEEGESISSITVKGSINKLINSRTLTDVLEGKGYNKALYSFYVSKNHDEIIIKDETAGSLKYTTITRSDLFDDFNITSVVITPSYREVNTNSGVIKTENIQTKFIELTTDGLSQKKVTIANEINSYFDVLTFTPVDGNIYTAINQYSVIFPYNENISIVNTFNNGYSATSNSLLFYHVESLHEDYFVRFMEDNKVFEQWNTKALDNTKLAIKRKNVANMNYNFENVTIDTSLLLGSTIELPKEFVLANNEKIQLDKYIITSINEEDINYLNRYKDHVNENDYIFTETIYVDSTRFNKLKYSNINEIESINYKNDGVIVTLENKKDYILLNKEGIILWLNEQIITDSRIINIKYNINKAVSFNVPLEELYAEIQYPVEALELVNTVQLEKISKDQEIDLNIYPSYADMFDSEGNMQGRVVISCSNIGFNVEHNNDVIKFVKNIKDNTIAIKTGFYYIDGTEYFLFANENFDNVEKIDDVYFNNVTKNNHQFVVQQQTTNYVTNSAMKLNKSGNIYELSCSKKEIKGVSALNSISACESFNYWNVYASSLSIVTGLNGLGVKLTSMTDERGYAYINLSKFLTEEGDYTLSFFLSQGLNAYLGKERKIHSANTEFNQQSLIDIVREIPESSIENYIYETEFHHLENEDYFLIITGTGVIDDIIVTKTEDYDIGNHKKNISHLNLDITENIYSQYNTRLYLTEKDGSVFDGTEINDNSAIINSSHLQWGFTKIKEISTYDDFKKCSLTNLDYSQYNNKCVIKSLNTSGVFLTNPIYIGNVKTIKNFLFKVNNIMFSEMKGFKIKVLTADNASSTFKEISQHLDNIGAISGDILSSYVKIMVEMPVNKVINNIELFVEYLSDEKNNPAEMPTISGTYISKVLDAQYNERFLIKSLGIESINKDISNYVFEIRASKENNQKTVWTEWKTIKLKPNYNETDNADIIKNGNISTRIVFSNYRYFQFRLTLKGQDASIKINHMDLEVI